MRVSVITQPAPIVSLDEAKWHLIVEGTDEARDAYIESLIAVATAWLDAPDGWLGRALGEQTLEAAFPTRCLPATRDMPYPPFLTLVSSTPSADGRETVMRWKAGYPVIDDKSTVPAPIRHAILLMVGHLFAHRDAVTATTAKPEQLPLGVDALLSPYRVWSV